MYKVAKNEKTKTNKMSGEMKQTTLFDIKGDNLKALMQNERISLTCAPGGENHRGNQLIGRMPVKGEGFTATDIDEGLGPNFSAIMGEENVEVIDLNANSLDKIINMLPDEYQARVILLRNWVQSNLGQKKSEEIYGEMYKDHWDSKYLDPNKDKRDENGDKIIGKDGKPLKGRVLNKHARRNICYVAGMNQTANYDEGEGTIVDLKSKAVLYRAIELLKTQIAAGLVKIDSKTKVEINVVEGNRYYKLYTTGIGFHGDTERVVVICITIGGGGNYPMRWQWFKDGLPVGEPIDVELNDGDVYIMSEKAVGADWKKKSMYTLRHAAGAEKYRTLKKWLARLEARKNIK